MCIVRSSESVLFLLSAPVFDRSIMCLAATSGLSWLKYPGSIYLSWLLNSFLHSSISLHVTRTCDTVSGLHLHILKWSDSIFPAQSWHDNGYLPTWRLALVVAITIFSVLHTDWVGRSKVTNIKVKKSKCFHASFLSFLSFLIVTVHSRIVISSAGGRLYFARIFLNKLH